MYQQILGGNMKKIIMLAGIVGFSVSARFAGANEINTSFDALSGKVGEVIASQSLPAVTAPQATTSDVANVDFKTEQKLTKAEATNIMASLSNNAPWIFDAPSSFYRGWVTGFKRDGDRIAMTTMKVGSEVVWGKWIRESTMKFYVVYFNWCGQDCHATGEYTFKVESKDRVVVSAEETSPYVHPQVEYGTKKFDFVYTQWR